MIASAHHNEAELAVRASRLPITRDLLQPWPASDPAGVRQNSAFLI
jgi:hypothetical protein